MNDAQPTRLAQLLTKAGLDVDRWILPGRGDVRWVFTLFLASYVVLGHFMLSFNRSPLEIGVALAACCALDMLYTYVATQKLLFPLSGFISGLGLAILFTAPGNAWLMLFVSWMTITGKHLVSFRGQHFFNPTNLALVAILVGSGGQAAVAPAYQWGGKWGVSVLVIVLGLIIMRRVKKLPLVLSFWAVYCLGALVRAQMTHMPWQITLWATVSGGAFMLFSFFMITDPKTSPSTTKGMIQFGAGLGLVDFWFQLNTAVFSLFYALFAVTAVRGLFIVYTTLRDEKADAADNDGTLDDNATLSPA